MKYVKVVNLCIVVVILCIIEILLFFINTKNTINVLISLYFYVFNYNFIVFNNLVFLPILFFFHMSIVFH